MNYKFITLITSLCLTSNTVLAKNFSLSSPQIKPNSILTEEQVFNGFGCLGKNQSPELNWQGAPKDTKSFAITVYDPDAPTGSGWWHWLSYNIPSSSSGIKLGAGNIEGNDLPKGTIQGRTDFGSIGFGGACPPKGDKPHRYIFTIYALKVEKLEVPQDATAALIGFALNSNLIKKTSFTAKYGR